jgi:hypothetical protein
VGGAMIECRLDRMTLTLRVRQCVSVALLCGLFSPVTARAQDSPSQIEIGGQAGVSDLGYGNPTPGFGGWLDVNVSRHVALETRLTWSADSRGDRTLHLAGGLRATFLRTPRFAWYGLALPGLYHFPRYCETEVTIYPGPNPPAPSSVARCAPPTHFALDLGSGLAFAPSSHFVTRIELNRVIHSSPYEDNTFRTDHFVSRWDLNAGVSYRLGRTLKPQSGLPAAGRWIVGSQIGDTFSTGPTGIATLGAFGSYTLSKYCDIDASVSTFLSDQLKSTEQEGGRLLQGLAGVKIGVREGRFGVFGKARAGVNSYSRVFTGLSQTLRPMYGRSTVPALDIGGVVETYLSGRTMLRIDIGETLSFVPNMSIALPHSVAVRVPGDEIYGLPLRVGFGWRF